MFEPAEYHHGFVFSGGKPAVGQVFRELLERKILEYKMEILEYDLTVKVFRCYNREEFLILGVVRAFVVKRLEPFGQLGQGFQLLLEAGRVGRKMCG